MKYKLEDQLMGLYFYAIWVFVWTKCYLEETEYISCICMFFNGALIKYFSIIYCKKGENIIKNKYIIYQLIFLQYNL